MNSIYMYNYQNLVNLPVKDRLLYKLLKSYFNLKKNKMKNINLSTISRTNLKRKKSNNKTLAYLVSSAKLDTYSQNLYKQSYARKRLQNLYKRARSRLKKLRNINKKTKLKKTYLSLPEIKHFNNKLLITISLYNRDKIYLKKKVYKHYKIFIKKKKYGLRSNLLSKFKELSKQKKLNLRNLENKSSLSLNKNLYENTNSIKLLSFSKFYQKNLVKNVFNKLNRENNSKKINLFSLDLHVKKKINIDKVKHVLQNKLTRLKYRLLKKYHKILKYKYFMLKLCIVNFRMNNSNLLGLKNIIRKIYSNKKIIIKIINLKYMYLDSNIVSEAITKRLKNRKKRVLRLLKKVMRKINKVSIVKGIWLESLNLNLDISSYNDENKLLNSFNMYNINPINLVFYKEFLMRSKKDIRSLILYNLNHKTISGIKMQGSGRLTKRLTASRSVTKFRSKGSLKNINSSYHSVSTVMLRGYFKSNLQYVNINSHNRNGSFGIKTWISSY